MPARVRGAGRYSYRLALATAAAALLATALTGCVPWWRARVQDGLVLVSPERALPPEWASRPPQPTKDTLFFVGIAEQSRQESLARNLAFADALGQIAAALSSDVTENIRQVSEEMPGLGAELDTQSRQSEVTDVFAATRVSGARQQDLYIEKYALYRDGEFQYYLYKAYMLVALDRRAYERAMAEGLSRLKAQAQQEKKAQLEQLYDEVMRRRLQEGQGTGL